MTGRLVLLLLQEPAQRAVRMPQAAGAERFALLRAGMRYLQAALQ